jgi:hypothetical protein
MAFKLICWILIASLLSSSISSSLLSSSISSSLLSSSISSSSSTSSNQNWIPPSQSALALQDAINVAISSGKNSYTIINGGKFLFNSASLNITSSLSSFILYGEGAELIFAVGSASIIIRDSINLTIYNLTIDSSTPTFTQGFITLISDSCFSTETPPLICVIDITVDDGFPNPTIWCPTCETKLIFFNPQTKLMIRPQIPTWLINATSLNNGSSYRLFTQQLWEHSIVVGDVVIVASRACGPCTYQVINSSFITTRNVSIHSSCNMAFYELGGGGGNIYDNIHVTTRQDDIRYLASNFDAFHSEGTMIGPSVTNSYFSHIGDDFFNVQNAIDIVLGFLDNINRTIVVADSSFGSTYPISSHTFFKFFLPQQGNAWLANEIYNATICNSTKLQGDEATSWILLAENASTVFFEKYGWTFANFAPLSYDIWTLTICEESSTPNPDLLTYTTLAQVNSSFGAKFTNNYFEDNLVRGGVLVSPNSTFKGNTINGTQFGGLLLSAEITWLSGNLGNSNVAIIDNTFIDCCPYTRIDYPYGICNNTITPLYPVFNPGGVGGRSSGIIIENNTILD